MAGIFVHLNGEQRGPFPPEDVRAMLARGEVTPGTPAWREGLSQWSTISLVLESSLPPGAPPVPAMPPPPPQRALSGWLIALIVAGSLLVLSVPCLCGFALGPIMTGIRNAQEHIAVEHARLIATAMVSYSLAHHGSYPDGVTSTAVFQELLDGNYLNDPKIFYIPMPGKVAPTTRLLDPKNVCFDVTGDVNKYSPQRLPLVFSTGYRMTYLARTKIYPDGGPRPRFPGLAIVYRDMSSGFLPAASDGSIDNVVPYELTTEDSFTHWTAGPLRLAPTAYWQLKP